jgi:dipeptidyl aminopeptidase/acylaminoacyl peptidase
MDDDFIPRTMSTRSTMSRRGWLRLAGGTLAALQPLFGDASLWAAPARLGANMTADGVPRFEHHALGGERELPALRFAGWHPVKPEMLVLMRRGPSQQLHRLAGPGLAPEPLTEGRDGVGSARWEPAAGYLVFTRDQGGNEAWRLYRLDAGGDAPVAITPEGERVSEYAFLPAGQGLVYLQERLDRRPRPGTPVEDDGEDGGEDERVEAPRVAASGVESALAVDDGMKDVGQEGAKDAARELDASKLLSTSPALANLWWVDPARPQERRLLGATAGRLTGLRVSPAGRVLAMVTRDGRSQTLAFALDGSGARAPGAAARLGLGTGERTEDILWRRNAAVGEFRHLVRDDVAHGRHRNELTDVGADLEGLAEPPAGSDRPLALVYNVAGVSALRLYRPGTSPVEIAQDLAPGVIRGVSWHPTLPLLGFEQVSAESPSRLYVHALEEGTTRPWSAAGEGVPLRSAVLRWKSFDGLEITGLHIAPPARFTGPRPVYISLHGGPSSQARPGYVAGVLRALVEQLGMHLVMPNVRGSDGFGKTFLKLDNGRLREDAVKDVSALLDLVAARSDMDAARVVVAGGSYGGYLSLAVATHESPRLAGSICRVGIANFVSFLENTESYRRDNRRAEYGDERDPAMREFLTSISPLTHAEAVRKPLMVVHGRNDPRVPFGEAQAMVAAVRAQGTPVWFVSASDEGHSFTKADNRAYLNQASFEFVRRVIGGISLER